MTCLLADSSGVPPSYVVPVEFAAVIAVPPLVLMLSGWPFWSNAKLLGAEIELPLAVQFEVSSSAMNASL